MSQPFEFGGNFLDHLIDSFWAALPEQTAEDWAKCKKDALNNIKSAVSSMVDNEINWTDRHLENARRMREERDRQHGRATATPPPNPS